MKELLSVPISIGFLLCFLESGFGTCSVRDELAAVKFHGSGGSIVGLLVDATDGGVGTKIDVLHLGQLNRRPTALSGALSLLPHDSQVTEIAMMPLTLVYQPLNNPTHLRRCE